ncbi:MAG TPA: hypothetical protein VFE60_20675 [Roseiarcus sp.]|jgi:hypothetical protein|nr:hypothetical protein [Roseiarcus sp.]
MVSRFSKNLLPIIRIAITQEAFEAIARTLPLGSVGYENEVNERGERLIWLEDAMGWWATWMDCAGRFQARQTPPHAERGALVDGRANAARIPPEEAGGDAARRGHRCRRVPDERPTGL